MGGLCSTTNSLNSSSNLGSYQPDDEALLMQLLDMQERSLNEEWPFQPRPPTMLNHAGNCHGFYKFKPYECRLYEYPVGDKCHGSGVVSLLFYIGCPLRVLSWLQLNQTNDSSCFKEMSVEQ